MAKILVIEDEDLIRDSLLEILKEEGFEAIAAENGRCGSELAIEQVPDLILCDILMPEINGYEVLTSVRQNANLATVPFIFLTSKTTREDFREGMELGADDYLTKPFTRKELLGAVHTQLKKRLSRREYYNKQVQQAEKQLNALIYHDTLTQLPNRLSLREQFEQVLGRSDVEVDKKKTIPILCVCLDRLAKINETLGYRAGNLLLKAAAERLKNSIGQEDKIAYLNDNKFAIILAGAIAPQDAIDATCQILNRLCHIFVLDRQEIFVTASIGLTFYGDNSSELEDLLEQAYIAMNCARKQGGNQYQLYTRDCKNEGYERISLETALRRAIEREELQLHYQPKVSLVTGKIVGVEALVRWERPEQGMISPGTFIPIAEETGLIVPLGEWVLKTACQQVKHWNAQLSEPIAIAVNVSGRQFVQPDFSQQVNDILLETKLAGNCLELEITESVLIQNPQQASQKLRSLKIPGIRIAIDDFGTGYSSLSYLRQFPFDTLKIDRAFVSNLTNDAINAAIVTAIIQMAHSLNLKVVAEGVETEAELAFLCQHGCDEIQGYLFSRPLNASTFEELLAGGKRLMVRLKQ